MPKLVCLCALVVSSVLLLRVHVHGVAVAALRDNNASSVRGLMCIS
jgi:hypothetical protein